MTFQEFTLHPSLLAGVRDMGFDQPTGIQAQAIPPALEKRDVLACAMTGSGKTAAFLLPIAHHLLTTQGSGTRALVISPTRELAAQIHAHFVALTKHTKLRAVAIYGGVGMKPQEAAIRSGVDLIVATPGRLLDHLRMPYTQLDRIEHLVLDEADRMLDMGFLPDVRRILAKLPTKRQTLFFSATMPGAIITLSREMLREPARIDLERRAAPATGVSQSLYPVPEDLKPALFVELLKQGVVNEAIVFCRTKHRANRLADVLERAGFPSTKIHGNRSQAARTEALAGFRSGRYRVLVATDIVARGIDVEALEHVVNFDVPAQPEDYIHRVGRTARADATGIALTFVSPAEESSLTAIERAVGKRIPRLQLPGFDYRARAERFEVPIGDRIAEIRKRKAEDRERARQKAERKAQRETTASTSRPGGGFRGEGGGTGGGSAGGSGDGRRPQRRRGSTGPRR